MYQPLTLIQENVLLLFFANQKGLPIFKNYTVFEMKKSCEIDSFYRWGKWGLLRLNELPKWGLLWINELSKSYISSNSPNIENVMIMWT